MDEFSRFLDVQVLMTRLVEYLPRIFAAILILAAFWLGFRVIRRPLEAALERMDIQETIRDLLVDKLFRYAVMLMALVMAADQLGFNVGAALAGLGVAGIALGFAAQDSVANVIAGIMIFWDKPFQVGDWIETEGEYGKVAEITLRSTRIRTMRNTFVVIPNKRVVDATLENCSKHGALRIDVPLGIAYKENVSEARKVLLDAVGRLDGLSAEHGSDVVVTELGDSSVNLAVRVWIDSGEHNRAVFSRVLESSKTALDEAGIEIPFPHLQLFVDDVEDRVWKGLSSVPDLSSARSVRPKN
jgi:small conductance mechanosensitive channel